LRAVETPPSNIIAREKQNIITIKRKTAKTTHHLASSMIHTRIPQQQVRNHPINFILSVDEIIIMLFNSLQSIFFFLLLGIVVGSEKINAFYINTYPRKLTTTTTTTTIRPINNGRIHHPMTLLSLSEEEEDNNFDDDDNMNDDDDDKFYRDLQRAKASKLGKSIPEEQIRQTSQQSESDFLRAMKETKKEFQRAKEQLGSDGAVDLFINRIRQQQQQQQQQQDDDDDDDDDEKQNSNNTIILEEDEGFQ
jgi:hypothetical protein